MARTCRDQTRRSTPCVLILTSREPPWFPWSAVARYRFASLGLRRTIWFDRKRIRMRRYATCETQHAHSPGVETPGYQRMSLRDSRIPTRTFFKGSAPWFPLECGSPAPSWFPLECGSPVPLWFPLECGSPVPLWIPSSAVARYRFGSLGLWEHLKPPTLAPSSGALRQNDGWQNDGVAVPSRSPASARICTTAS